MRMFAKPFPRTPPRQQVVTPTSSQLTRGWLLCVCYHSARQPKVAAGGGNQVRLRVRAINIAACDGRCAASSFTLHALRDSGHVRVESSATRPRTPNWQRNDMMMEIDINICQMNIAGYTLLRRLCALVWPCQIAVRPGARRGDRAAFFANGFVCRTQVALRIEFGCKLPVYIRWFSRLEQPMPDVLEGGRNYSFRYTPSASRSDNRLHTK